MCRCRRRVIDQVVFATFQPHLVAAATVDLDVAIHAVWGATTPEAQYSDAAGRCHLDLVLAHGDRDVAMRRRYFSLYPRQAAQVRLDQISSIARMGGPHTEIIFSQ